MAHHPLVVGSAIAMLLVLPASAAAQAGRAKSQPTRDGAERPKPGMPELPARVLSIAWNEAVPNPSEPSASSDADEPPRPAPLKNLLGEDWDGIEATRRPGVTKPAWIYYFRGGDDVAKREAAEDKMFSDPSVVYASRFFRCLRVDVDRLPADDPVRGQIDAYPSFAFEDLSGRTISRFSGVLPTAHLFNRLSEAYKTQFDGDLKARIAAYVKVVDAIEKIEARATDMRAYIRELEFQVAEKKSAATERELDRCRKELEKELDQLPQLRLREKELMTPPVAKGFEFGGTPAKD